MFNATWVICLIAIALGPWACRAGPILQPQVESPLQDRRIPNPQCGFAGNADVYGLGIRIGIYLQWISGFLANCFHADSVQDMLSTNTIFLLALFTALAIITQKQEVKGIEVVILLQFCFGFLFSVSTTWGLRVRAVFTSSGNEFGNRVYFPLLGSTIRLCLSSAICSYNLWFWFRGFDQLEIPGCQALGVLFAQVDLSKRSRVFFKITAVLFTSSLGLATLSEIVLFIWNWICYGVMTLITAVLISLHKIAHKTEPALRKTLLLELASAVLTAPFTLFVLFLVTPWIMVNADTGLEFKRQQSWFLLVYISSALGFLIGLLGLLMSQLLPHASPLEVLCLHGIESNFYALQTTVIFFWNKLGKLDFELHKRLDILPFINVACILWSITAIELMIKWNNIIDVHTIQSVGQLIPFIIGVVGFIKLLRDIHVETFQQYLYDIVTKSLLQLDLEFYDTLAGNARAQNAVVQSQPATDHKSSLEITACNVGETPPEAGDSKPEDQPQAPQSTADPTFSLKLMLGMDQLAILKLFEGFTILLSMLQNRKDEWEQVKGAEILRYSIPEKIVGMMKADASESTESIKKTNAVLALELLSRFNQEGIENVDNNGEEQIQEKRWRKFLTDLHRLDVNPHLLAVRWLKEYATFWLVFFEGRWEFHKGEVWKGKGRWRRRQNKVDKEPGLHDQAELPPPISP